jgi:hypothetical protein
MPSLVSASRESKGYDRFGLTVGDRGNGYDSLEGSLRRRLVEVSDRETFRNSFGW